MPEVVGVAELVEEDIEDLERVEDDSAEAEEEEVEVAALSCLVENGVGSAVCLVAVTLLTPIADRYFCCAWFTLMPEFGDVKLLMQTLI